jgi:hypothetical protein
MNSHAMVLSDNPVRRVCARAAAGDFIPADEKGLFASMPRSFKGIGGIRAGAAGPVLDTR